MNEISEVQAAGGPVLFQLKITLKYSRPPIWRRVVVRSDIRLDRLHTVIQLAMGWTNSHLHQFTVGQTRYSEPDTDFGGTLNEKRYTLRDLAPAIKKKFTYEYDFGDSWAHEVKVEKVLTADPDFKHPVCVGGENACPLEDCGGISGYYRLLEILADPNDPEHENMKEWLGEELDPTQFNPEQANAILSQIKT